MPKIIASGYDELVTTQRFRIADSRVLHHVRERIYRGLLEMDLLAGEPRWLPGRTTQVLRIRGGDLRLTRLPGAILQAEVHSLARELHVDPNRCRQRALDALEVVELDPDLDDLTIAYTKRFSLHADVVGVRLTHQMTKRILAPRAKWAVTSNATQVESLRQGAFQIYDKTAEIRSKPQKAWIEVLWPDVGDERVTRIEIRFCSELMRQCRSDDPAELWNFGLDRFSLREHKGLTTAGKPIQSCPEARLWRQLRRLTFTDGVVSNELAKRVRSTAIASYGMGVAWMLRGVALVHVRSGASDDSLAPVLRALSPMLNLSVADVEDRTALLVSEYRSRLEGQ